MIFSLPKGQDSNTAEFAIILKMEIFIFPEESGLSFLFDVDEELTDDKSRICSSTVRCAGNSVPRP